MDFNDIFSITTGYAFDMIFVLGVQFMCPIPIQKLIFRFCRSKCHKNFKMKRNPRKVKWTKAYRRLHGKDMTQDSTFEFERKRNRPEKYDRNVTENVLTAIKKITKVRATRSEKHIAKRLSGRKAQEQKAARNELDQSLHMIKAPDSLRKIVVAPEPLSVDNRMEE